MNRSDRYIADVMRRVLATPEDRQRLEADLRSHFAEGETEGRETREIIEGLGTPEEVATAFNAEREICYAGFWRRLVAFIGDFGVLMALTLPAAILALMIGAAAEEPADSPIGWIVFCAFLVLGWVGLFVFYFPLLEARFGKTLGKHLLRIRVVRENGTPISLGQAFVRRLSLYFKMLVIDSLFIPFTDRRQRALDIIAKTVVAREPGAKTPRWAWAACLLIGIAPLLVLLGLVVLRG